MPLEMKRVLPRDFVLPMPALKCSAEDAMRPSPFSSMLAHLNQNVLGRDCSSQLLSLCPISLVQHRLVPPNTGLQHGLADRWCCVPNVVYICGSVTQSQYSVLGQGRAESVLSSVILKEMES